MNSDVQVLIECAQCGEPLADITARYGDSVRMPTERERCPKCVEPTYGPLTIEMVADALHVAGDTVLPGDHARYPAMARFVIRLLDHSEPSELAGMIGARRWLLDLARQP